ncbi:MAG TPA: aminotransferase class V-fold PLP-dependent enzyme [Longimicrobiales bacterium]|jgi:cysteine desulfurase family protein
MSDLIYLDNAATTFPKPDVTHDTARDFYRENGVNPGRTGCDMALKAEEMIHGTRKLLSDFFNPSLVEAGAAKDPNRLVFTLNATMSLNLIINGTVGPGDHAVTTLCEHNSVIRPLNHRVLDGAEVAWVAPDAEGYVDPEDIRAAIEPNTTLVIVNHGSNVSGVVQDLAAIGAVCREEGVPLAVDAAQTAGVLPIDMAAWNVSFLSFTGHKSLFGPPGTGGICVADDAHIRGTIYGGTGVRSAHPYHLEEFPYRLEAGTLNMSGIAGLGAGVRWIQERGCRAIHQHEMELLAVLQEGLADIDGVDLYGTTSLERRVPVLSCTVTNYDASDVGVFLDVDHDILTRTGLHCAPLLHEHYGTSPRGTVRMSIGPFNTREDVLAAVRAVEDVQGQRPAHVTVAVGAGAHAGSAAPETPRQWGERDGC